MEYSTNFRWFLNTKPSFWIAVQEYLLKNPEKKEQLFKLQQKGHLIFPVGNRIFLCTGREDKPVAIIQIVSYEQMYVKDEPVTIVYFRIVLQLRNSQKHNLREVFRYLL